MSCSDSYGICPCCDRLPSDFYDSEAEEMASEIAIELFEFSRQRTRRESQWERLFGYMNGDYGFSFYGETRLETLTYYAEFRRQQKRDGLLRRFPGAGRSFDRALQQLGRIGALK